jgi:hypothetical protein
MSLKILVGLSLWILIYTANSDLPKLRDTASLQPREYGCVMHDTHNIFDPTTTSNRENHL